MADKIGSHRLLANLDTRSGTDAGIKPIDAKTERVYSAVFGTDINIDGTVHRVSRSSLDQFIKRNLTIKELQNEDLMKKTRQQLIDHIVQNRTKKTEDSQLRAQTKYEGSFSKDFFEEKSQPQIVDKLKKIPVSHYTDQDSSGKTLLKIAIENWQLEVAKQLMKNVSITNLKIDMHDGKWCYPLHLAVKNRNIDMVKLLLDNGANPALQDSDGNIPSHNAIQSTDKRHVAILELLSNVSDSRLNTPLHLAAEAGNEDAVKLLLSKNASVYRKNNDGKTPLTIAIEKKHTAVINLLLLKTDHITETPAQPHDSSMRLFAYNAPFHAAIRFENKYAAQQLLDRGVDINSNDRYGNTPLHTAILAGNIEMAKFLIARGADINAIKKFQPPSGVESMDNSGIEAGTEGDTPLHTALKQVLPNRDLIELLLKNGAKTDTTNDAGQTPASLAQKIENEEIKSFFLPSQENVGPDDKTKQVEKPDDNPYLIDNTYLKVFSGDHDKILAKIKKIPKGDINLQDGNGRTLLDVACERGDIGIAKYLISRGADVGAAIHGTDENGNPTKHTALHTAIKNGNKEMVKLLLKKWRDLKIDDKLKLRIQTQNEQRYSPYLYAISLGRKDIVDLFLEMEVTKNNFTTDSSKTTDLHLAAKAENQEMFIAILESYKKRKDLDKIINAFDAKHETPLHIAVKKTEYGMASKLLEYGADVNAKDPGTKKPQETPLELAQKNTARMQRIFQKHAKKN